MKTISTDNQLDELLNNDNVIVLDQAEKHWFIFQEEDETNCTDDCINISVEQFERLENLALAGKIYRHTFMTSNTTMLLSYMSWENANRKEIKHNKEQHELDFEM